MSAPAALSGASDAPHSVAALVAALTYAAPAAAFEALERRVTGSPARAAEATSRGAVRAALPLLLDVSIVSSLPEGAVREAVTSMLAALCEATEHAAAAVLGMRSCRGCRATRAAALHAVFLSLTSGPDGFVPEGVDGVLLPAEALAVARVLADCLCDTLHVSVGGASARLTLALLGAERQHVRNTAVAALLCGGALYWGATGLRNLCNKEDDESSEVRCAAHAAHVLARLVAAVPRHEIFHPSEAFVFVNLGICLRQRCWAAGVDLPAACAVALAASHAPPLQALLPGAAVGWAGAPRGVRATLGIAATAVLAAVCPLDDTSYRADGERAIVSVAREMSYRPGAFAGLVAGAHALTLLRGHVMHPLPPLLDGRAPGGLFELGLGGSKVANFTYTAFHAAVSPQSFGNAPEEVLRELHELRLFSAEERFAGLSYGVLMAALRPYRESSNAFDRFGDNTLQARLWHYVHRSVDRLGALCGEAEVVRAAQLPNVPAVQLTVVKMQHPAMSGAAMAAVAVALPGPLRARTGALACGAHELGALVFTTLVGGLGGAPAFALRAAMHMLGRALCAGTRREEAMVTWLLRTCEEDTSSPFDADPGTRLWLALRVAERRAIAVTRRILVRAQLERLAWVRAAETGAAPTVDNLAPEDLRQAARKMTAAIAMMERLMVSRAHERAERRQARVLMARRDIILAASAMASLRAVQGGAASGDGPVELALWQHGAFLGPCKRRRSAYQPYGNGYFSPAAAAARAAAGGDAAAAPSTPPGSELAVGGWRVVARQADFTPAALVSTPRPPPPPPPPPQPAQPPPRVALLVGGVAFDVPSSRLTASPLLDDLLHMHAECGDATSPLRLTLGADVPAGAESATFALLLSCLEAAEEAAAADAARRSADYVTRSAMELSYVLPPELLRLATDVHRFYPLPPPPTRRIADPELLLPAWSAARHLQLDAVTDALGDPLAEWLSRQAPRSAAWFAARDAAAAAPHDDALAHALARAEVRAAARAQFAALQSDGEDAARIACTAWLTTSMYATVVETRTHATQQAQIETYARWAAAMGRALHAEAALLLPTEAWYARKMELARRLVVQGKTVARYQMNELYGIEDDA